MEENFWYFIGKYLTGSKWCIKGRYIYYSGVSFAVLLLTTMILCTMIIHEVGEGMFQFIFNVITSYSAIIVTIATAASLILAYMIAFSRASTLGIPFRYARASVHESIEVIVSTVSGFGFGLIAPIWIIDLQLNNMMNMWESIVLSFFSIFIGYIAILYPSAKRLSFCKYKKVTVRIISTLIMLFILFIACIAANVRGVTTMNIIGAYIAITFAMVIIRFVDRLMSNNITEIIATIDGKTYLLGMQHAGGVWALFPCELVNVDARCKLGNTIHFEYRNYIVRKIEDLEELQTVVVYKLLNKTGVHEKEDRHI